MKQAIQVHPTIISGGLEEERLKPEVDEVMATLMVYSERVVALRRKVIFQP